MKTQKVNKTYMAQKINNSGLIKFRRISSRSHSSYNCYAEKTLTNKGSWKTCRELQECKLYKASFVQGWALGGL